MRIFSDIQETDNVLTMYPKLGGGRIVHPLFLELSLERKLEILLLAVSRKTGNDHENRKKTIGKTGAG